MVSGPEYYNLTNYDSSSVYSGLATNQYWWVSAPVIFTYRYANGGNVFANGGLDYNLYVHSAYGVRPAVSLKAGMEQLIL